MSECLVPKKQVVHGSPARKECPKVIPFLWFRKHHWHLYRRDVEESNDSCFFMPTIKYEQQYEECCWCQKQREYCPPPELLR